MNLDIIPNGAIKRVHVSQNDVGRTLTFELFNNSTSYSIPSGATVKIQGTKPSGLGFSETCTVSGNTATIDTTEAMTDESGNIQTELSISYDDVVIGTSNFVLAVEKNPHPSNTTDGTQITAQSLEVRIEALEEAIESGGSGLTDEAKQALLNCFAHVAWIDEDGQDYYDDLYDALYEVTAISLNSTSLTINAIGGTSQLTATTTPSGANVTWSSSNTSIATVSSSGLVTSVAYGSCTITATAGSLSATCSVVVAQATVTSINAVYTQSGTVYDTDSLSDLTSDLVVTATWSDSTTSTVSSSEYTLSGTLTVGTSTITVSYGGQTATFNVTVTHYTPTVQYLYNWDFTNSLIDSVNSKEASLTVVTSSSNTLPTRTSSGVVFNEQNQLCYLGDFGAGYFVGKTIEVDVAEFDGQLGASSQHYRFIMLPSSSSKGTGPLIYKMNTGWAGYDSSWGDPYGEEVTGTSENIINYFSGKTVKIVLNSLGEPTLYVNDDLIGSSSITFTGSRARWLYLGGISGNTSYCYNMTISGLRIYES